MAKRLVLGAAAVVTGGALLAEFIHPGLIGEAFDIFEAKYGPHIPPHRTIDQLYAGEHDDVCVPESSVSVNGLTLRVTGTTPTHNKGEVTVHYDGEQAGQHHTLHVVETGPANETPPFALAPGHTIVAGPFARDCVLTVLSLSSNNGSVHR